MRGLRSNPLVLATLIAVSAGLPVRAARAEHEALVIDSHPSSPDFPPLPGAAAPTNQQAVVPSSVIAGPEDYPGYHCHAACNPVFGHPDPNPGYAGHGPAIILPHDPDPVPPPGGDPIPPDPGQGPIPPSADGYDFGASPDGADVLGLTLPDGGLAAPNPDLAGVIGTPADPMAAFAALFTGGSDADARAWTAAREARDVAANASDAERAEQEERAWAAAAAAADDAAKLRADSDARLRTITRNRIALQADHISSEDSPVPLSDDAKVGFTLIRAARAADLNNQRLYWNQFRLGTGVAADGSLADDPGPALRDALRTGRGLSTDPDDAALAANLDGLLTLNGVRWTPQFDAARAGLLDQLTDQSVLVQAAKGNLDAAENRLSVLTQALGATRGGSDEAIRARIDAYNEAVAERDAARGAYYASLGNQNGPLLATEIELGGSSGPLYTFLVQNSTDPALGQQAIDAALGVLQPKIDDEFRRVVTLWDGDDVLELGSPVYGPLRAHLAADPTLNGLYPGLAGILQSTQGAYQLAKDEGVVGELVVDLSLLIVDAAGVTVIFFFPFSAPVIGPGLVVLHTSVEGDRTLTAWSDYSQAEGAVSAGGKVSPDSLDDLRFRRNLQTGVLVVTGLTGLPDLALGASAARSSLGGLRQGATADASAGARAVTQVDDLELPSGTLVESMEVPPSSAVASAVPEPPGPAVAGAQPATPPLGMAASPFGDLPPARAPPVITDAQVNAFPDPTDVYKRDVLAGQVRFADGSVLDLGRIELRLGRGSSSQVYKPADGFVVKFTAPEGTAAESWGHDLVRGLDLQHSSIPRLHQEIPITEGPYAGGMIRVYDEAAPPLGPLERLPGGDLTPGQAQAITDAARELNGHGVVVGDLHSGNLSLTPIGDDRYIVEFFDNGVYLATDPATASALQTHLLNPGARYLNQIGPIRLANDLADTFDPLLTFPPGYTTIRPGADAAFPMAPRLGVQSPTLRAVAGAEAPGVAAAGATPPVGAALPGGIPPTPKPTPGLSVDLPPSGAAADPTPRVAIDLPPSAVTSAPTPRLEIEIPPSAASGTGTPLDPFPWTTTARLSGQGLGDAILEADAMRAGAPEPMPGGR